MGVRLVGINHIAFEVTDLDETLTWYERFFDIELRGRRERMAWIDLGDQFIALSEGDPEAVDRSRHVGIVVQDKEELRRALREAGLAIEGAGVHGSLRVRDPSGNLLEIVDYRDVQFTKTAAVLHGMGLDGLEKSPAAQQELRAKGLG